MRLFVFCAALVLFCLVSMTLAAPASRPGASSRPSSSRPSTSSRPSSSAGSRPATRPSASSHSAPSHSAPSHSSSSKPSGSFGSPSHSAPSHSAPSSTSPFHQSAPSHASSKPAPHSYDSAAARSAKKVVVTRDVYAARPQRIEYHYGPSYVRYQSMPVVHVGGGYSSIFWYSMLEWDLQRRAIWLYHHQNTIDQQLFQEQLKNEALKAEIDKLKAAETPINWEYVDPALQATPDVMYDDAAIETETDLTWLWTGIVVAVLLIIAFIVFLWYLCSSSPSK